MPSPGIVLIGFMPEQQAISYLAGTCFTINQSPAALSAEWRDAKAKIGPPVANAGNPSIEPIPAHHQPYMQQLNALPWCIDMIQQGWDFRLVEIDPLLAFQSHVDLARSATHCNAIPKPPSVADLLPICLPLQIEPVPIQWSSYPHSFILKSRSLNLRMMPPNPQMQPPNFIGIQWAVSLPFVQVVRFDNRCYLSNGYHRAYGAKEAGATHVPCLFREAQTFEEVGAQDGPAGIPRSVLESADPPTVSHFSAARGYSVSLKATTRIIHVTWSDYAMIDE